MITNKVQTISFFCYEEWFYSEEITHLGGNFMIEKVQIHR